MGLTQRSTAAANIKQQVFARHHRKAKSKKGTPKASTLAVYAGAFALIIAVVAVGYNAPQASSGVSSVTESIAPVDTTTTSQASVDDIIATNIAASMAEAANLSVANNVANLSVSLTAKSELAQSDDTTISKPAIVQPAGERRTVVTYVTKAGDTVDSVADQYGLSKDTIKWANNLTSDALEVDKTLTILPTDGVLYTVKSGDTIDSIVEKYQVDKARLISYNDLELTGVVEGSAIILPDGVLPDNEKPGYTAPSVYSSSSYSSSYTTVSSSLASASAGNRYAYGNCTWYAYERRVQLGLPVGSFWGNAATWSIYARAAGYVVNNTPSAGAIMQNGGGYGHVAIVESVAANGDITITEMNYAGNFNRVTSRIVSAGQAANYNYIH